MRTRFNNAHDVFIVPAIKDKTQVSRGRGGGGLATIWKCSLKGPRTSQPKIDI